jgi:acetylornithine/succinyldiaminopimelate/putrescine aminotransferase
MLILDEIQCGMGRCGAPFAFTEYNITPDILCVGKALGGGMPIGAFVSSRENISLLSHSPVLGHITTFGGHPVATAGSGAVLHLLKNLDWVAIERRGAAWEAQLKVHPLVKQVRRKGYFFAVEMESEELITKAIMRGLEVGVLLFWFLSVRNAFRLQPPLTMTDEEADTGIALIISALEI